MDYDHPLFVHTPAFMPVVSGEEMCRAMAAICDHVMAIIPRGREVWEVHVDQQEIREKVEVEGIVLRGRLCEASPRFPGGTWVRVRGLPLNATNAFVDRLLSQYGEIAIGSTHATWRNTAIKTGERTLKLKINKDIPGRLKTETFGWVTVRYRDQPELCFSCGQAGHQQWDCEVSGKPSYATVVERVGQSSNPTPTHSLTPTQYPTPTATLDPAVSSPMPSSETSTDEDGERKKKKKEKKERREEREKKERKRELSSDTTPEKQDHVGKHEGLPTMIPMVKHVDKRKK